MFDFLSQNVSIHQHQNMSREEGGGGGGGWMWEGAKMFQYPKFVAMIENENTEEEIRQWTENHREAVAIYHVPFKKIE